MCLNPKWIYKKGNYKENNYRGMKGEFYELGTYSKCGTCNQCIAEKANNWVIRNYYESKAHKEKCFITLTYAENPFFIVRKDLVDFIKRFRFEINKEYYNKLNNVKKFLSKENLKLWKEEHQDEYIKTRNFYVGEYGTIKGRPHFHVIVYGWEDKNIKYLGINKKKNIIYQSNIIQKCWGLGRTTYQNFGDYEAPYIALYNTAQETFKKSYKITLEKANKLKSISYSIKNINQRKNLIKELNEYIELLQKEKEKYIAIKEFNGWSIALGWEEFEKEYNKQPKYAFTEYIEGHEYVTPTPWLKKLANMGDIQAAEEIFRREKEIIQSLDETEERNLNLYKLKEKRKKEKIDWAEQSRKNGEIAEL